MSLKCDGTNGVLQQYDYQTPSTGFSYTFAAGTQTLFMVPAATLATGTITMPSAPADGMVITFSSSQQITALTLQGNTGQSVSNAVTFLPAKTAASYVYRLANTTWYPCQTVPGTGSQLVSGTAVSSTSGTSIDFTGIPSWVKSITVMFSGVSTNGTSQVQIQLGSGSAQTTGYRGSVDTSATTVSAAAVTTGLALERTGGVSAANSRNGTARFCLIGSNIWAGVAQIGYESNQLSQSACAVTLSGTLDRVRITTVNGTDAFDAGSVNILYE